MKIELYTEIEKLIAEGYSFNQMSSFFLLEKGSVLVNLYFDGRRFYYKNTLYHRDGDLPAVIRSDGSQYWYKRGRLHRAGNKPAVICINGQKEYWLDGAQYTP